MPKVKRTKYCPACTQTKSEREFHGRGKYLMGYCKLCQCARVRKDKVKIRAEIKRVIQEAKSGKPCTDCGEPHPYWAMDFDHLDPTTKSFEIARANSKCTSVERLLEEIAKCELVCALCHRYRTNGMRRRPVF